MLKRYLVFYGDRYYPQKGMSDFQGEFDSLKEAYFFLRDIHKKSFDTYVQEFEKWENQWDQVCTWGQVYDCLTKTILWNSDDYGESFLDVLKSYDSNK